MTSHNILLLWDLLGTAKTRTAIMPPDLGGFWTAHRLLFHILKHHQESANPFESQTPRADHLSDPFSDLSYSVSSAHPSQRAPGLHLLGSLSRAKARRGVG
jgi:hypothetical protein